jgi:cytidine deaminase
MHLHRVLTLMKASKMSKIITPVLGTFVRLADLTPHEQVLVHGSWLAAERAYTPLSKFPVGAMLHARNKSGFSKDFLGCNVENRFMSCVICAERNGMTSAVAEGYSDLKKLALVCQKYQGPGASPCGLCRQVLFEFGRDAVVFQAADPERNVSRYLVRDLLPAASGDLRALADLEVCERRQIGRLLKLAARSHVPYSKKPGAALFTASNAAGLTKSFAGVNDDNSSYGGSAAAEAVAMRTARTAGYVKHPSLKLLVDDPKALNPIEGESLQVLREFGTGIDVTLVGADGASVRSNNDELLPDSFGPASLV